MLAGLLLNLPFYTYPLYGGGWPLPPLAGKKKKRKPPPLSEMVRDLVDDGAKHQVVAVLPKKEQRYWDQTSLAPLIDRLEKASIKAKAEVRKLWLEREAQDEEQVVLLLLGVDEPPPYPGDDDEEWILF